MIVCNRCGKENQNHYKFCLGCGAELAAAPPAQDSSGVGMMKTMMADTSHSPPGAASVRPTANQPAMPGPSPSGGFGTRPPAGPPPGVAAPPMAHPTPGFGSPPLGFGSPPGAPGWPAPGTPMGAPPVAGPAPMGPAPMGPAPMGPPPSQAAPAGMRKCPQCGSDVPVNFKFCGSCGNAIGPAPSPVPAPAAMPAPMAAPAPRASMTLIRPDGSEGGTFQLEQGENRIGRSHGAIFENDGYLSPTHASITVQGQTAVVTDLASLNGVFVRMSGEEEIEPGQIIRMGQELLRFDLIEAPAPLEDGTEVMGSPNPGFWGKVTVIIGKDVDGSAYPILGDSISLGRERGEVNFPDDGYVSGLHARLSTRGGKVYIADLGSSNGTFVKIHGERKLGHDSYVLLGQQLFRLALR